LNPFQLTQNLVFVLNQNNFVWPDPPGEAILGRVGVTPARPDFFTLDSVVPFALIHPETTRAHAEHPADIVEEAHWTVALFGANATDQAGGAALVGGNRASLGSSRGRGILEVESRVKAALFTQLGLVARLRSGGTQPPDVAGRMGGFAASRALEVVATRLPALHTYAPVQQLLGTSPSSGHVSLTWAALPSARYDLVGYTWVRVSGSTPATSPTGGTFVAGAGTTLSDAPGTGTWSYTIFWAYDRTVDPWTGIGTTPATPNRWSSSETAQNGVLYLGAPVTVAA
jgi:hypothetical protein